MYGGQDLGVLELDTMSPADAMFIYDRFVWMSQTNVPVMLLDPSINRMASVLNVNLTAFAGYAVHAWSIPLSSTMDRPHLPCAHFLTCLCLAYPAFFSSV
jgi:hypothetical protein